MREKRDVVVESYREVGRLDSADGEMKEDATRFRL